MADLIFETPGLRVQLGLVLRLRWRLFVNGLRSRSARVGLVGSVILGLVYVVFAIGGGIGIGVAGFFITRGLFAFSFGALLWGIAVYWQLFPAMTAQYGSGGFDTRSLQRFPIRLSAYATINVAEGFADPIALVGIFWHLCLWLGVVVARPDLWWAAGLTVALSVLLNVLFGRMAEAWFERLLSRRRTRELALALFMLVIIGVQFARFSFHTAAGPLAAFLHRTNAFWEALPPGRAGLALAQAAERQTGAMLIALGGLLAWIVLCAGLLLQRLRAEYLGEVAGETEGSHASSTPAPAAPHPRRLMEHAGIQVAGPRGGPVRAILVKEARYLARNSLLAVNFLVPLIVFGFLGMRSGPLQHAFRGPYVFLGALAYMAFLVLQHAMNNLGFDSGGIQIFFLAPIPFRSVLLAKNLLLGSIVALEAVLGGLLMTALGAPPSHTAILLGATGLVFFTLVSLIVGNWFSLHYPWKRTFGARNQRAPGFPTLVFMLCSIVSLALLAGLLALGHRTIGERGVAVEYAVLDLVAFLIYRARLDDASEHVVALREKIIDQLVR